MIKNCNLPIPRPRKVCPGYRRSLQLTKEAIQHFKTWIFSTFVGHFCPPGSGSGPVFKLRIRIQWSDWIRIQYGSGSGSTTLVLGSSLKVRSSPIGSVYDNLRGVNLKPRRAYVLLFLIMRARVSHKNVIVWGHICCKLSAFCETIFERVVTVDIIAVVK